MNRSFKKGSLSLPLVRLHTTLWSLFHLSLSSLLLAVVRPEVVVKVVAVRLFVVALDHCLARSPPVVVSLVMATVVSLKDLPALLPLVRQPLPLVELVCLLLFGVAADIVNVVLSELCLLFCVPLFLFVLVCIVTV